MEKDLVDLIILMEEKAESEELPEDIREFLIEAAEVLRNRLRQLRGRNIVH